MAALTVGWPRAVHALSDVEVLHEVGPVVGFEERIHDFGKISAGVTVKHDFHFTNSGDQELTITRMRSSCACTAATTSDGGTGPGGSGAVTVTYDSLGAAGPVAHVVYVHTNDPDNRIVQLLLRGSVEGRLGVSSKRIEFGDLGRGQSAVKSVDVYAPSSLRPRLKVKRVVATLPFVEASASRLADTSSHRDLIRFKVHVKVREDAPVGSHRGAVLIHTNSARSPVIRLAVLARVLDDYQVRPPSLFLGPMVPGPEARCEVEITSRRGAAFRVVGLECDPGCIHAEVHPLEGGAGYRVCARVGSGVSEGLLQGSVNLELEDGDRRTLRIPFHALISGSGDDRGPAPSG